MGQSQFPIFSVKTAFLLGIILTWRIAESAQIQRATPFYLNPGSPFASGQIRREELEKTAITQTYEPRYEISVDSRIVQTKANAILRDLDFSTEAVTREDHTPLFTLPRIDKKIRSGFSEIPNNRRVHIVLKEGPWVLVRLGSQTKLWVLETYLRTYQKETGCFRSFTKNILRNQPNLGAPIVTDIPSSICLVPLKYTSDWIQVQYDGISGWLPLKGLIHKTDFAQWVHWKDKWQRVLARKGATVTTDKGIEIPLAEIDSVISDPVKAIANQLEDTPQGTPARVLARNDELWVQSKIPEHGLVWWKKFDKHPLEEKAPEKITTEELLRREIYSADFDQDKTNRGIVSASGIYITNDGKIWSKLKTFNNENHPVSLHPLGYLIVGSQYSRDEGRSFTPYVRWDLITKLLETYTQKSANQIVLHDVKSQANAGMKLTLFTGTEKISIKGFINENSWEITK